MGYYSTLETNVVIKKDKIKSFNKMMDDIEKAVTKIEFVMPSEKTGREWEYYFYDLRADDEGRLHCKSEDNEQKWYNSEQFVDFLKGFVESGTLQFVGEDGEGWGWEFKDGKIRCLSLEWKEGVWE